MGLMNMACAIYIVGFMAVLGTLCIVGYFKNFYGKEGEE